jgi:hypothetical protein
MISSVAEIQASRARSVDVTDDTLSVDLTDGRTISVPTAWYPRLAHATAVERSRWRLIGHGEGIHWPDLDEDISVENLLSGKASGESQKSLRGWLESRNQR